MYVTTYVTLLFYLLIYYLPHTRSFWRYVTIVVVTVVTVGFVLTLYPLLWPTICYVIDTLFTLRCSILRSCGGDSWYYDLPFAVRCCVTAPCHDLHLRLQAAPALLPHLRCARGDTIPGDFAILIRYVVELTYFTRWCGGCVVTAFYWFILPTAAVLFCWWYATLPLTVVTGTLRLLLHTVVPGPTPTLPYTWPVTYPCCYARLLHYRYLPLCCLLIPHWCWRDTFAVRNVVPRWWPIDESTFCGDHPTLPDLYTCYVRYRYCCCSIYLRCHYITFWAAFPVTGCYTTLHVPLLHTLLFCPALYLYVRGVVNFVTTTLCVVVFYVALRLFYVTLWWCSDHIRCVDSTLFDVVCCLWRYWCRSYVATLLVWKVCRAGIARALRVVVSCYHICCWWCCYTLRYHTHICIHVTI